MRPTNEKHVHKMIPADGVNDGNEMGGLFGSWNKREMLCNDYSTNR